jgi:DNA-binding GntR family transcriptional regulator
LYGLADGSGVHLPNVRLLADDSYISFVSDGELMSAHAVRGRQDQTRGTRIQKRTRGSRAQPARELLADRAYAELRDRLVTLRIAPGEPIDEDLLGRELGIGRTPVREAIKRLALENLVTVYPRRGTFASEINITDLAYVSDVRVQLEGLAAERAAQHATPAQRAEAEQLIAELHRSRGSDDTAALMELDTRVHRFVYQAAGNPFLEETLGRYFNLSLRIWYVVLDRLPHLFARVHEHGELLRAIVAADSERARAVVGEHISTFDNEIRSVL